nr:hypothetical protein [Nocardia brevicatena]
MSLGVSTGRIFIDRGFSGTTRKNRTGLDNALHHPSHRQRHRAKDVTPTTLMYLVIRSLPAPHIG